MKFLVYGDVHWSETSSIVRSFGKVYTTRLHNVIDSVNWAEQQADLHDCDAVICLGDFFDKESLSSEEITALGSVYWSMKPHYMLVGNHEMGRSDLLYSSAHVFYNLGFNVVADVEVIEDKGNSVDVVLIPYILESDREELSSYIKCEGSINSKRIIFSHNDIAGIQMGRFKSVSGFSINEIKENCELFVNGHLHNGVEVSNGVVNLGNLTGQNFSEDAFVYKHRAAIVDTSSCSITYIDNPYALNFYKLDNIDDFNRIGKNAVVTIRATEQNYDEVKAMLANSSIIASRIVLDRNDVSASDASNEREASVDHLQKFQEFVGEFIGTDEVVAAELMEVCK